MCEWTADDSGDGGTFVSEGWRRAKRKKKCDECQGVITRRSRYFETVFTSEYNEDAHVAYAMCKACRKIVREFTRIHGDAPYISALDTVLEECIDAEEQELEDEDADHEEARAAIAKWNLALAQMAKRANRAKAVANG